METGVVEHDDLVLDRFGYWPTFHDATIYELILRQGEARDEIVEIKLEHAEMLSEVDEAGYYKLVKHSRVHLRFHGVCDIELKGNAPVCIIMELMLAKATGPYKESGEGIAVVLGSSYGVDGKFWCKRAEVVSLESIDRPKP